MSKFLFIIIVLYSKKSFDEAKSWLEDLRKNSLPDLKIFLIGNKSDLEESRLVTKEQGIKFKEENNLYFFTEASAKSEKDAQEIFIEAAKVLYQYSLENKEPKEVEEKNSEELEKSVENEINPYDLILRFKSIESIKQEWDILLSETGLKYFNSFVNCPKIGVLGNTFVGKSFVLSTLFGFPKSENEYSIYTNNQITIKMKERKNKINYILFDSIGLDNAILNEKNSNDEFDSNNEGEENNIKNEKDENNKIINNDKIEKKEKPNGFIDNKNFEELEMNKKLTEKFITSFMVDYIDMLIVVIRDLKYSDQLMLKNVIEECLKYKKDTLYVIHNNFFVL